MTRRSLSASPNAPDSIAASAAAAVAEPSSVTRGATLVSVALNSAMPVILLAGTIGIEQASRSPSVPDLVCIDIGPPSSRAVGPMRAGCAFDRALAETARPGGAGDFDDECASSAPGAGLPQPGRVTIELYGSLGTTSRGYTIDRAAVTGLADYGPEAIPVTVCESLMEEIKTVDGLAVDGVGPIPLNPNVDIHLLPERVLPYHVNGMALTAYCANGAGILRHIYYPVGDGLVMEDVDTPGLSSIQALATAPTTQAHAIPVPLSFTTSVAILAICEREGLSVSDVVLANELFARSHEGAMAYLDRLRTAVCACIEAGVDTEDILPGGLGVCRRAKAFHERLRVQSAGLAAAFAMADPPRSIGWVDLFAPAVDEENAVGRRAVAALTNSAAGIVPAILTYYERFIPGADDDGIHCFLLAATTVGGLTRTNASIAGAKVGYQGEVGSTSSMAAADLIEAPGGILAQAGSAAEIAMEHNLGLTCDLVSGFVQTPCIERSTVAAVRAINVIHATLRGGGRHAVSLDTIIETMRRTSEDMLAKYREISRGDLAINVVEC